MVVDLDVGGSDFTSVMKFVFQKTIES
jgi:hypothetical protein